MSVAGAWELEVLLELRRLADRLAGVELHEGDRDGGGKRYTLDVDRMEESLAAFYVPDTVYPLLVWYGDKHESAGDLRLFREVLRRVGVQAHRVLTAGGPPLTVIFRRVATGDDPGHESREVLFETPVSEVIEVGLQVWEGPLGGGVVDEKAMVALAVHLRQRSWGDVIEALRQLKEGPGSAALLEAMGFERAGWQLRA